MKKFKAYYIRKYALILVCFYIIEAIASPFFNAHIRNLPLEDLKNSSLEFFLFSASFYFLSIILAVIVYNDIRILRFRAKYAVLCTVVLAPLGVCLFLLYVILDEEYAFNEAEDRKTT